MALIGLFFIIPPLLAGLIYFYHDTFEWGTTQQGEFLQPPLTMTVLQDKWTVLYVTDTCDATACYDVLEQMQQIPIVLSKESQRLQLALITPYDLPVELPSNITQITLSDGQWQSLATLGNTFISDPHGNVILTYPEGMQPKKIYKDLKKLLKASRIG